ncbi:flagellar export protein FliJ [Caulobacter sp. DWR1-3-2b1]|uniref:flagellar export protein FliJ n=1 Tax=Caulobacter sp. DWR1-3-2b1 TaxID=2804670 RepID=UPI003CEC0137
MWHGNPRSGAGAAVAALLVGLAVAPGLAAAQSSSQRDAYVPFGPPVSGDGYTGGQVGVSYAFLNCFGEIHIGYSVAAGTAKTSDVYLMAGKTYVADGVAPQPSSIRFAGTVSRGGEVIGSFADPYAGSYSAKGCISGQTQKVGMMGPWVGKGATPDQIINFLNSLSLRVEPAGPVRDGALESRLKAQDRARQAAVDNQQRQEKAAAEARRVAEERRKAEAAKPVSRTPTGQGGGYAPQQASPSPQPAPRPLTDAQRGDKAIESDRILAQQRLAEQQRVYHQQQLAAVEAERQRQIQMNAAMVQAAPIIYGALESVTNSIDQAIAQAKANRWAAAQSNLIGKCTDTTPDQWPIAKDGDLVLGVPTQSALSVADCGANPSDRYKTFRLMIDEPTRVRIKADGSMWMNASIVLIGTKPQKIVLARHDAPDRGVITFSSTIIANLTAGEYHVMIRNAAGAAFRPFTVVIHKVDAKNKVIPTAPPNTVEAFPSPPQAPPPSPATTRAIAGIAGVFANVAGSPQNVAPAPPTPRQSAAQIAAQPLQTVIVTDKDKADVAARKSRFAIGWTPSRVVEINARGNFPAGSFNTKCNKLVSATPEPTLLTYKAGEGGQGPGGIMRYAGEGSRCRPQTAGVIQYADGTQWIGGVISLDATPFLPQPEGLGEFKFAEGVSKILRARKTADGSTWEIAEEFVEPPPQPPEVAKPPTRKATSRRRK